MRAELSRFEQEVEVPQAHEIANLTYGYIAEGFTFNESAVLAEASRLTSDPKTLDPNEFGFAVVRNARLWWNFRLADLKDDRPTVDAQDQLPKPWQKGLDPAYKSYADRLTDYHEELSFIGHEMAHGDADFLYLYDYLAKKRIQAITKGEAMANPLKSETKAATSALLNVLDAKIESEGKRGEFISIYQTPDREYVYDVIIRRVSPEHIEYVIERYINVDTPNPNYPRGMHTRLTIHEYPDGRIASVEIDTYRDAAFTPGVITLLTYASDLRPSGKKLDFERLPRA